MGVASLWSAVRRPGARSGIDASVPLRLTVVLSTYQQPEWLEKSLWGYARQRLRDFELIVADDGSSEETAQVVERCRDALSAEVRHLWQEDRGFRKCRILNKAIRAARGNYLVFSDGDCIPRRDFLVAHAAAARPGRFLSGGYVKLSEEASRKIDRASVDSQRAFSARWLGTGGHPHSLRKLRVPDWTRRPTDLLAAGRPTWNGHNVSAWRSDVLAVNGFDERMGYGGEDRELGERLENFGVRGLRVRYRALCVHLEHPRDYVDADGLAENLAIRCRTQVERRTWSPYGIDKSALPRPVQGRRERPSERG